MKRGYTFMRKRWWVLSLFIFVFISVFCKFIANDLPIIAKTADGIECLTCQDYFFDLNIIKTNPRTKNHQAILHPIIKKNPNQIDYDASNLAPFQSGHLLGTDSLGRDVMAGVIHGASKAFIVGIFSIALAFLIALIVGGVAGFYQNEKISDSILGTMTKLLLMFLAFFYIRTEWLAGSKGMILPLTLFFTALIVVSHLFIRKIGRNWSISPAFFMDRVIELREIIPGIFLIIAALSLFTKSSLWNVVWIIGLVGWSGMARYIRAEIIQIKAQTYYKSAKVLGLNNWQLIKKHLIPNALDPIYATVAFAIASAILLEASLSFLGLGVPPEEITWGSLLAEARKSNSWWLALFPGLSIFLVISTLQAASDFWRKRHHR